MSLAAVITADIVNSTRLSKSDHKKLMNSLLFILQEHKNEFFRGDSFQVYIKSPAEALSIVLQMRTAAMKLSSMQATDIRASIGIGLVNVPVRSLKTASDEPFILSGRAFDKMKPDERLLITASEKNKVVNLGLNVLAQFLDYIFLRLTSKQAAVVFELLMKRTQTETAKRLKKSQATIHKHTQSAGWPQIEKLLAEYQYLIQSIEP